MDKETNHSESKNDTKKPSGRRNHCPGRNTEKWNKREESTQGTRKERQSIMGRRQNNLYGWKNLCTKLPENQGKKYFKKTINQWT